MRRLDRLKLSALQRQHCRDDAPTGPRARTLSMAKKDPTDFTSYIGTCFEHWILPVLPCAARLEVRENGTTIDPANCGKIPGKYL